MRFAFLTLLSLASSTSFGLETIVEVRNRFSGDKGVAKRFAKLVFLEGESDNAYLFSCKEDGSELPESDRTHFASPILQGEKAHRVFRFLSEPELAWAIPATEISMSRAFNSPERWNAPLEDPGTEMVRAWSFNPKAEGEVGKILTLHFDDELKTLLRVEPIGFKQKSGFTVDVAKRTPFKALPWEHIVKSRRYDLLNGEIRPYEEMVASSQIQEDFRLFIAVIHVLKKGQGNSLTLDIPLREVAAPKDGKVYVAVETQLLRVFNRFMGAPNKTFPELDLRGVHFDLQEEVKRDHEARKAAWEAREKVIPEDHISIFEFNERDLNLVDRGKYAGAIAAYELIAMHFSMGNILGMGDSDFALDAFHLDKSLPACTYVASNFLGHPVRTYVPVQFTDFLKLGMMSMDRMMDCAKELVKQGVLKLAKEE